jgi:serine/threonine protein kinase
MAPEVLAHNAYHANIDVWSFGAIMYWLFISFPPFLGIPPFVEDQLELMKNIEEGTFEIPIKYDPTYEFIDLLQR